MGEIIDSLPEMIPGYLCIICRKPVSHDSTLFCSRECELKYIEKQKG